MDGKLLSEMGIYHFQCIYFKLSPFFSSAECFKLLFKLTESISKIIFKISSGSDPSPKKVRVKSWKLVISPRNSLIRQINIINIIASCVIECSGALNSQAQVSKCRICLIKIFISRNIL